VNIDAVLAVACNPSWMLTAAASRGPGFFIVDLHGPAVEVFAIQTGNSGAGFMAFHFDKAKTLALAGKDIRHELG
jgi:hypothetical protein